MKPRAAMYSEIQAQHSENDLLVQHAPLVKRIAHHMLARLPDSVQLEDLIQSGMIGLLEAARQFDSSQGASFTTYAGIRIRGAMLDEIRRLLDFYKAVVITDGSQAVGIITEADVAAFLS
jgi:RNA polymerase sigma factor for flagellar operon FliA